MMLMRMKLDKSQVPDLYQYKAAGSYNFAARNLAIMAGYTTYKALIVGAAGGFGRGLVEGTGYAAGMSGYGGGPGGGGSLVLEESLKNLSPSESISVGSAGANASGTSGNDGGNSSFHGYSAYGGQGAHGNSFYSSNSANYGGSSGYGGDGGGNSAGLGSGGIGGNGGIETTVQGNRTRTNSTAATAGTFQSGSAPVVGGGKGGGGGPGYFDPGTEAVDNAKVGANGNSPDYQDNGNAASMGGFGGGAGGGADLYPITGVHEYYGDKGAGKNGQGAVVIKLS